MTEVEKVKFPIRAKLMLIMSAVAVLSTAAYLSLAVKLFKDDKTSLIWELNSSTVRTLSSEVENTLTNISDKVQLLTRGHRDPEWIKSVFEAEPDLVAYTLFKPAANGGWHVVSSVRNKDYLKLYDKDPSEIDKIRVQIGVPFEEILNRRTLAWNSTLEEGVPLLTLALSIEVRDGNGSTEHVAVADLRLDRILKLVANQGIMTLFLVDRSGKVIAHPDAGVMSRRESFATLPIVQEALASPIRHQLKKFTWKEKSWLGGYSLPGIGGIAVISQIDESQVLRVAWRLIEKSLLFALLIVTIALFLSSRVARNLTEPLRRLVEHTARVARWEFGETIHVKSNDEIANLAHAFNSMTSDLRNQHLQLESGRKELELKVKERTAALEKEKKQTAEAQDALLRTTRLASLGELAGVAAHEVLNPANNINIRVEKMKKLVSEQDDLKVFGEITQGWRESFQKGGWDALKADLTRPAEGGKPLIEEDLGNLESIAQEMSKRLSSRLEDLDFLSREVIRITKIINNMRSLSRVGGERHPIDIHLPLEDTAMTLAEQLSKKGIALIKEFSGESRDRMIVVADRDELVQVFSNLVRNALQAIESASRRAGEIRISTRRSGERVEIRISDNGTGISWEHANRIFEPNFTTKTVQDGTGLGLSITRRLLRAFGGDIELEKSDPGVGTVFLIWLPATEETRGTIE